MCFSVFSFCLTYCVWCLLFTGCRFIVLQPHPLAERLPKIIIRSQAPQNTPPVVVLPTRKTRSSLIHQNTGTSPLHQKAYTTPWTNLSHWGKTPKTTCTHSLTLHNHTYTEIYHRTLMHALKHMLAHSYTPLHTCIHSPTSTHTHTVYVHLWRILSLVWIKRKLFYKILSLSLFYVPIEHLRIYLLRLHSTSEWVENFRGCKLYSCPFES